MAKILGNYLGTILSWVIICFIAWKFPISAEEEYGWFSGLIQGGFLVPNFIVSFFSSNEILYKAPIHTSAYTIFWWIGAICVILLAVQTLLKSLLIIFVAKNKK